MEPKKEITRIIGSAKIVSYEVTFESVSYSIEVRQCSKESLDRIEEVADYVINMVIPFTGQYNFFYWLRNPAFTAMKESWAIGEDNCYFEQTSNERVALMTLNGSVALIPVGTL